MKPSKQERFEAAGWKLNGTKEFLHLTDEAAMIEVKLQRASALQAERTKRRLSQDR